LGCLEAERTPGGYWRGSDGTVKRLWMRRLRGGMDAWELLIR
jgi:hypothetical protein